MPRKWFFLTFVLLYESRTILGYGSGAPPSVCGSMTPNHGVDKQDGDSPFVLGVVKTQDDTIVVSVLSPENESFEGFFLQARRANDKSQILGGTFSSANSLTKHQGCGGENQENTLTHTSTKKKENVTSIWTPPANFKGRVVFRATVAKSFDVYWTNLETVPVMVGDSRTSTPTRPNRPSITTSTTTTTESPTKTRSELPKSLSDAYEACGRTKGCFGLPTMCEQKKNCEVLLVYVPRRDGIEFEMTAPLYDENNNYWIAMGLSEDKKMGGDAVTECLTTVGNRPGVRQSWNEPGKSYKNKVNENGSSAISNASVSYSNGILSCSWKRKLVTNVEGFAFNIAENNFFLLLAKGESNPAAKKSKHKSYLSSQNKVNLTRIELVAGNPNYLLKIHGAFMIVAWIGLVSIGILLARHYKTVWEDRKICSTPVWFFCHRSLMFLSVGMIIAAFVVIFLHVDGWSQVAPNPHPIIGCISTGLAVLQPLMATFRPKPSSSKRYIFNWLHWLVGNAAQIIAIVTMYFAVDLSAVSLSRDFNWVLTAFVAFHFMFHLIMQFHTFFMEKKMNNEIQMQDLNKKQSDFVKDSPGSGFRRFMLGIYITVVAGLVTAMVLMVCLQ